MRQGVDKGPLVRLAHVGSDSSGRPHGRPNHELSARADLRPLTAAPANGVYILDPFVKIFRRPTWGWIAFGILIGMLAIVRVTITGPRVHVRWDERLGDTERADLERQFNLHNGSPADSPRGTWRYELGDLSRENIGALLQNPAVADTAYIDRDVLRTA